MALAVGDQMLAFLLHFTERDGGNVRVNASSMNPGFFTSSGVIRTEAFQNIVNRRVLSDSRFQRLRFALVDLTETKLLSPQFAGHRETEQGGVASMAKLACMYAAYQLQFDLQALAGRLNITDQKKLFDGMRATWQFRQLPSKRESTIVFADNPRIEEKGGLIFIDGRPIPIPAPNSSPDLERIFVFSDGRVNFIGSEKTKVDLLVHGNDLNEQVAEYVDKFDHHGNLTEARKLSFADRLFLMIDDSDNPCTRTCIENIGFLYIISSIWQADFYRPERGGGLWEGGNHNGLGWHKPPVPRHNPNADFISGTAASIASLFTLMAQDKLVSKSASASMRELTNRHKRNITDGSFNRSFFEDGLDAGVSASGGRMSPDHVHAKIGIGAARSDSALIVRKVGGKELRYVAVGCDDPDVTGLHELIVKLDKCIQENNGLLSASSD